MARDLFFVFVAWGGIVIGAGLFAGLYALFRWEDEPSANGGVDRLDREWFETERRWTGRR